jgi:serine/threonine-protein kinase/endoribonuclease IRE1
MCLLTYTPINLNDVSHLYVRPDTTACLVHPFFWSPAQRLSFLQDASDRFEIMEREPPEEGLVSLESQAEDVVGLDWHRRLDKIFIDNLGKFRKYNGKSVQDLLRALRNKVSLIVFQCRGPLVLK